VLDGVIAGVNFSPAGALLHAKCDSERRGAHASHAPFKLSIDFPDNTLLATCLVACLPAGERAWRDKTDIDVHQGIYRDPQTQTILSMR
jgi:hypothetical protein